METSYRPGTANGNADGMSRQAWPEEKSSNITSSRIEALLKEKGNVGTHPT